MSHPHLQLLSQLPPPTCGHNAALEPFLNNINIGPTCHQCELFPGGYNHFQVRAAQDPDNHSTHNLFCSQWGPDSGLSSC